MCPETWTNAKPRAIDDNSKLSSKLKETIWKNFTKDYIEISNEFRTSKASKESVGKLYDLLYDLENSNRTKNDDLTLSNVYSLLGFHLSAYEVFKSVADLKDKRLFQNFMWWKKSKIT